MVFCEPNKLGFTIFGHLHHLLRFIEVGFITKITKHFYSPEIKKLKHVSRPTARFGPAVAQQRARPSAMAQQRTRPSSGGRERAARDAASKRQRAQRGSEQRSSSGRARAAGRPTAGARHQREQRQRQRPSAAQPAAHSGVFQRITALFSYMKSGHKHV